MATANPTMGLHGPGMLRKASGWFIAMAVVFILLGIMAIVEPGVAGLAVAILVGWLLIFGGVAQLFATFGGGGPWPVIWQVILGIIYIVGGIYFLTHPLLGLGTLTLLLAVVILAEAVLVFIVYFRTRNEGSSRWMLAKGLLTLLLGGLIWFHWPSSSMWAIGTLVGVNLLMTGFSRLMLRRRISNFVRCLSRHYDMVILLTRPGKRPPKSQLNAVDGCHGAGHQLSRFKTNRYPTACF